jgi:hypothetical protein
MAVKIELNDELAAILSQENKPLDSYDFRVSRQIYQQVLIRAGERKLWKKKLLLTKLRSIRSR